MDKELLGRMLDEQSSAEAILSQAITRAGSQIMQQRLLIIRARNDSAS